MVRLIYILTFALCMSTSAVSAQNTQNTAPQNTMEQPSEKREVLQAAKVHEYVLGNGMTLWVKPDHRSPTVTHMIWLRVGSRDEVDGASGIAHMLEHMMFRGTPTIPGGEFARKVDELGGNNNAFTSNDMTAYFEQIPAKALPEVMRMNADRFVNLSLNEADFIKEMAVVKEERRMRTDERPRSQLWERLMAAAYMADPYHRPIIGWMNDLDEMTITDVKEFYRRWYRPDNAAIIIVGDIEPSAAFALAQQTYGKIPAPQTPLQLSKPRVEPAQQGIRRIEHKAPASQSYIMMAYKVPGLTAKKQDPQEVQDVYALTLLAAVLDGTPSSRLPRNLVQGEGGKRIADSVGAGYGLSARGPLMFMLMGVPAQGYTPEELEQALRNEIKKIAENGVEEKELQRIKTQWVASQIYAKDSLMAQAQDLGGNWILNMPPDATDALIEKLRQVTPQQVQSAAQRYFGDDQLTVGILRAQPLPEGEQDNENNADLGSLH